jgi:hypothetical protein
MQADSFSRKGAGPMKERLQQLLSEAGESFDYLKSDIRHLSRDRAELEELIESYRAFAATATLSAPADRATQRKLLCTNTQNHWPTTGYARRDAPRACPV